MNLINGQPLFSPGMELMRGDIRDHFLKKRRKKNWRFDINEPLREVIKEEKKEECKIYLFLTSNEHFAFWKYYYFLQIIEQIFKNIFL